MSPTATKRIVVRGVGGGVGSGVDVAAASGVATGCAVGEQAATAASSSATADAYVRPLAEITRFSYPLTLAERARSSASGLVQIDPG